MKINWKEYSCLLLPAALVALAIYVLILSFLCNCTRKAIKYDPDNAYCSKKTSLNYDSTKGAGKNAVDSKKRYRL